MNNKFPGELKISGTFSHHLGPRYISAGLEIEFHWNQNSGINFEASVKNEYKIEIINGLTDGLKMRSPEFPQTCSIFVIKVFDHDVDSSPIAFYKCARMVIEQAFFLSNSDVS